MPHLTVNRADLHYEEHGTGPEAIVFAHGLLWSGRMFEAQVAALRDRYRCVTFDFRGQGQSAVTRDGYDMDTLAEDAAALIRALHGAPCHFVGLSMGGFIGMRLAIRQPELLRSLLLLGTSADPEPPENVPRYRGLNLVARWLGLRVVAGKVMKILYGRKFLADPERAELRAACLRALVANHRVGITRAVTGVITREGVYDSLDRIRVPTLLLVGDQDVATVPAKSQRLHERIAGSVLRILPGAGHSATIEEPEAVNEAMAEFLAGLRGSAGGRS
ncbi:MAG TPA: alpha/beta fold hydrolase [Thermoanaerobaculia bacterium]|nr:alpha/beta fold hydrolase [Thermoanaerobaculia bacterium]